MEKIFQDLENTKSNKNSTSYRSRSKLGLSPPLCGWSICPSVTSHKNSVTTHKHTEHRQLASAVSIIPQSLVMSIYQILSPTAMVRRVSLPSQGAELLTQRFSVPCPTSPSGEKGDVLPYHFTRTFRSGLVWGSGTVLAALFLMYATGSLVYYQRPLPECTRLHN